MAAITHPLLRGYGTRLRQGFFPETEIEYFHVQVGKTGPPTTGMTETPRVQSKNASSLAYWKNRTGVVCVKCR